ncbi:MAG TPA: hypothetical protein VHD81_00825 [Mycobacteriales bacterium]|nr:hypothetical protein [Mycobacteriales bacterium]
MRQATWRGFGFVASAALLMTIALGPAGPAAAARRAPTRPLELGAPMHVGGRGQIAVPALTHPPRNRAPQPSFLTACSRNWRSAECTRLALMAIENARAAEGVKHPALVLPRNYAKLSVAEQTFVLTDLERVARGLKPFMGLTRPLNLVSHTAAVAGVDPEPVLSLLRKLDIFEYGSNWAGDFGPLASDYDWMYNDGYSSSGINLACLSPQSNGCWGHRDNILGTYQHLPTLLSGAGTASPPGASIAVVLSGSRSKAPEFTYTWQEAKRHGADAHG